MAHRLLRNPEAERSDFPIICESCLGDNPYIRMQRDGFDKVCKTCSRPFTVFRWRPGGDARYKKTEICQTCCKLQNACQVCILNLDSGLPVQVHRTALGDVSAIPKSDVNRRFFAEEHGRMARRGIEYESSYRKSRPCDVLPKLQRIGPYYKRNRAHVCSFYVRGKCTRGDECPYRHEMPLTGDLSKQNLEDRYWGDNDRVATKLLNKAAEMTSLEPPDDESIKTLYVGGIDPIMSPPPSQETCYLSIDPLRMGPLVPSQYGAPSGPAGSGKNNSGSERQQREQQHHDFQHMHLPRHCQYHQLFYHPPLPPYQQHTVGNNIMLQ